MKTVADNFRMPEPIMGPMPRGEAQDPPVDQIALDAARLIDAKLATAEPHLRVTLIQLGVIEALNEALDRMQKLGGRRRV